MRSETNATHSESREAVRSPRECLDKRGEVPRQAVPLALRGKAAVEQPGEQPGEGRRRRAIDASRSSGRRSGRDFGRGDPLSSLNGMFPL